MSAVELASLFAHFMLLSVLSVGGAITLAPDMHRYMVLEHRWLDDTQFTASIAIAQAAPGPNVLFVALLGYAAGGPWAALATMAGIMLPSTIVSLAVARYGRTRRDSLGLRSFTGGLAPLTLGLLVATGWILAGPAAGHAGAMLLVLATVVFTVRFKVSPLWAVAAGAVLGGFGWV